MRRITAILLSLVVLFSTTGFTIATHLCGGVATDTKLVFLGDVPGCGMEAANTCDEEQTSYSAKSCCDNELFQIKIEDQYEVGYKTVVPENVVFLAAFIATFHYINTPEIIDGYKDYIPPPLLVNRVITHQVFRI